MSLRNLSRFSAERMSIHDYLQTCKGAVHLVGHGIAGLVGWLYTRQYPEQVRSLTLLSVGVNLATSWHSHYYEQRQLIGCSRETMLMRTVFYLFGYRDKEMLCWLADLLKQDLDNSLIPHSLYQYFGQFQNLVSPILYRASILAFI